ncbi:LamG-like jellyroll fold domain-containing protein [Nodosilinea sp. AN01ver1]|uniref:LamG-like jellyroll fold domain-containing protein n=1 Tax=Nodosilinea sp. AN01ver1 TaxID=3423362 RepID=UPI003D31E5F7
MQINRNNLQHLTSVQHQGLVFLFGIDTSRDIYYAVRRTPPAPTEPAVLPESADADASAESADPVPPSPWGEWVRLPLPTDQPDESVLQREREEGVDQWVRSQYSTADRTALAPIQVLSDGEHLFVFRQSTENTLLADRFLLDGGTERLVPKLEVRFKRSRQRFTPAQPQGLGGSQSFDTPDFRDFAGNFFFEPTQEIRLAQNLTQGWFAVVLTTTSEHEVSRWHLFAHNGESGRIELFSLRRSRDRLFELADYTVEEGSLEDPQPRQIPGLIQRTLVLRDAAGEELTATEAPTATRFCLQSEMTTQDGDTSFIKGGVRVMLAVPVQVMGAADPSPTLASLIFGVRTDGTLAQIDDQPQETLRLENNRDILLPADTLQQVRGVSGNQESDPDTDSRPSFTFDGVDDYIDVGSDRSLDLTRNFSIEAWVNPAAEKEQWIFAKQDSYALGLVNGNPVFTSYDGARYQMENVSIPLETWTHLAVVCDRRNTLHIYVNGELADTYEGATPARPSGFSAKIGVQNPDSGEGFWDGWLSEVRVWNVALSETEIQQRMGDRLLGRELGLVGYWPLMALANGETVDFSPESNTGRVLGAFPTGRRIGRRVGRRNAEAYRYGEVFSVVQGATYLESFEYRTDAPILPFDESAEAFEFVFEGLTGGRNGDPTDPAIVPAQIRPLNAARDDGWRVAQARFTIPEGMTHLRLFHTTAPGGRWDTLELRRHRVAQLASTVTQAEFVDEVLLPALANGFDAAEQALDELRPLEQEEAGLIREVRELEALIAEDVPLDVLTQQVAAQRQTVAQFTTEQRAASRRLGDEELNPFNFYTEINPGDRAGVRLQYDAIRRANSPDLTLRPSDFSTAQRWQIRPLNVTATGRTLVRIHPQNNLAAVLTADNSGSGTYTGLSVQPLRQPPGVVYQNWSLEFLQQGNPARVQFRTRQPDTANPVLDTYLLVVRASGSLTAEPVDSFARSGSVGDWLLINTGLLHDEGRAAIASARATFDRLTADLAVAQADLDRLEARLARIDELEPQLAAARLRLNEVQDRIRTLRQTYLDAVAALSNQAQTLPILPTTDGGTVQGGLLDFAAPTGAVTSYESVEGAVHLNFLDRRNRLRTTVYDAVAEVWRPNLPGTCLAFEADGANPGRLEISPFGGDALSRFTLSGWVRTQTTATATWLDYRQAASRLRVFNPQNLQVTINDQTTPPTGIALVDGEWHWLSVTWRGQDGQLQIYVDGAIAYTGEISPSDRLRAGGTLTFGADVDGANPWIGFLESMQVWDQVLGADEIEASQHLPLTGNEPGLLGYWPLEDVGRAEILDRSPHGYHGTLAGAVQLAPSTAPIGAIATEAALVVANEYPTQAVNALGQAEGLMRRFYAFLQADAIYLLQDQRIESLEVRWVGNAQFDPTLLGYIEGAPPVPSENLTEAESYDGTAAIQLNATENVRYSWTRAQEAGLGIDVNAILGTAAEASFGVAVTTSVSGGFGFTGNLSSTYSLLDEGTVTLDIATALQDRLSLRGSLETTARFPRLGRRYVPKNVGYALVVSSLADVFVLRLRRSRRMVSYQVAPVPDLPPQVNTVTFLINPAYQQNGTLDGQVGTEAADDRVYAAVPSLRAQYGSQFPASYFRIREAAELEAQIRRQDREREAIFVNYNSRAIEGGAANRSTDNANENNIEQVAANVGSAIASTVESVRSGGSADGWQQRLEQLLIDARKRNIVNTYVWDGDGGLRSETQEFADTIEQTIGGSFSLDGGLGITGFVQGLGVWVNLTALATAHITQVSTKTESRSRGFSLAVELAGESRGITRADDTAVIPGEKVDRYRFSSFYLEPNTSHFSDFFHQVVDPEWLMGNDEEARALRQISMVRPNPVWRVRHLVTFVERPALQGFGAPQAATVESLPAIPSVTNGNGRRAIAASAEQ